MSPIMNGRQVIFSRWASLLATGCAHRPGTERHCAACCREALSTLVADAPEAVWRIPDDDRCCSVCGLPLAIAPDAGCARGRCAASALPGRFYAPLRASREYGRMVLHSGTGHRFVESGEDLMARGR